MQPAALKTPRKTMPNMAGWADKIFQGRTKIFNTIAEKFYPRIKIFGRTIFFLTGPIQASSILIQVLQIVYKPVHEDVQGSDVDCVLKSQLFCLLYYKLLVCSQLLAYSAYMSACCSQTRCNSFNLHIDLYHLCRATPSMHTYCASSLFS